MRGVHIDDDGELRQIDGMSLSRGKTPHLQYQKKVLHIHFEDEVTDLCLVSPVSIEATDNAAIHEFSLPAPLNRYAIRTLRHTEGRRRVRVVEC